MQNEILRLTYYAKPDLPHSTNDHEARNSPAIGNCTENLMQQEIIHLKHYRAEGIYQQQIIGIAQSPSQNQTFYNGEEEQDNRHTILKQH
jgi:hypothetical protein